MYPVLYYLFVVWDNYETQSRFQNILFFRFPSSPSLSIPVRPSAISSLLLSSPLAHSTDDTSTHLTSQDDHPLDSLLKHIAARVPPLPLTFLILVLTRSFSLRSFSLTPISTVLLFQLIEFESASLITVYYLRSASLTESGRRRIEHLNSQSHTLY